MIYLIACKNNFPPVDEFTIHAYKAWSDLPYRAGDAWHRDQEEIVKIDNVMLGFVCAAEDPVEAMIKFWAKYMYGVDILEKGDELDDKKRGS